MEAVNLFISLGIYVISVSNIYPVSLDWAGYCSRTNAASFSRSLSKSRSLQSTWSTYTNDDAPSKRTSQSVGKKNYDLQCNWSVTSFLWNSLDNDSWIW